MNVREHYDGHLGNFYDWMIGNFDEQSELQRQYFVNKGVQPQNNSLAIDLGAGSGLHAFPLAKLGFKVLAVDFNRQLTDLLEKRRGNLDIKIVSNDMMGISSIADPESVELIVCMGDTIAHLDSFDQLQVFLKTVHSTLLVGGKFIVSFRDYGHPLVGLDRFIPVKSDENKIFTCVLDFVTDTHLNVTDMLYEREAAGSKWEHKISSYQKIRTTEESVKNLLTSIGFKLIDCEIRCRMIYLICEK